MVSFWLSVIGLILLASLFVVLPLLRPPKVSSVSQHALNVEIYKDRLATLEEDVATGQISQDQFEQAKLELDKEVLNDTRREDLAYSDTSPDKTLAYIVAGLLVASSIMFYALWGSQEQAKEILAYQASPKKQPHGNKGKAPSIEEAVAKLEKKLEAEPDNAQGWVMLGRSYTLFQQYSKAQGAYEKALGLLGDDPDVMTAYADVTAAASGQGFTPESIELIDKALTVEPTHPRALLMKGFVYFQAKQYQQAVDTWTTLRGLLEEPKSIASVDEYIAMGNKQLGVKAEPVVDTKPSATTETSVVGAVAMPVKVQIAQALKDKVSADMTVFIFAKAVSGPPMPLAAVKTTVGALGQTYTLSDEQAMTPQFKVSKFEEVKLSARIALSGTPTKQSGDFFAKAVVVQTSNKDITVLTIDQVLP